ncbi:plastocyanin/azurin family copper-binding protein [Natrialbaceae archaeon GCM10025810]|uniref:cupredoxin domain-containing protein n=1 Tax=Halovalidus salilacus TaxID=3075124 RepID=UPI00361D0055
MNRRTYLAAMSSVASAGLAGCSTVLGVLDDPTCDGEDCHISMSRTAFIPDEYETTVGETVVWKNTSEAIHTVTAYEGGIPDDATYFASGEFEDEESAREAWDKDQGGEIRSRGRYEHTFEVPGTYSYVCIPHERGDDPMTGLIHVSETDGE